MGSEAPAELLLETHDVTPGYNPGDLLLVSIEGVALPSMSGHRDVELMAILNITTSTGRTQRSGVVPLHSIVKYSKDDSKTLQGLRIRWRGKTACDFLFPAPKDTSATIEFKLYRLTNREEGKDPESSYADMLTNRLEDTYGTAILRLGDIALTPEIHRLKLKVLTNGAENILSKESFVHLRTAIITARTLQLKQKFSSLIVDRRAKTDADADNETGESETKMSAVPRNKVTRVFLMLTQIRIVFEAERRARFTNRDLMRSTWWVCVGDEEEPTQLSAVLEHTESGLELKWTLQRTLIVDGTYPPDLDFCLTGPDNNIAIGDWPNATDGGEYINIEFQHTTTETVKHEPIKEHSESFQLYVEEDANGNLVNEFDRGMFHLEAIFADPEELAAPIVEMQPVEGFDEEEEPIVIDEEPKVIESNEATHFLSVGILEANQLTNLSEDKINMLYRVVTTVASRRVNSDPDHELDVINHDHIGVATTGPLRPEAPSKNHFFTSKDLGTDAAPRSRGKDRVDWHSSSTALSSSWFNLSAHDLAGYDTIDILFDLKGEHATEVMGTKTRSKSDFPAVFASGQLRLNEAGLRMQANHPIEVQVDLEDAEGRFCGNLKVVLAHLVPAGLRAQPQPEFVKDFKSRALVPYSKGQQLENQLDIEESGGPPCIPPTWVALIRVYGAKNLPGVQPPPVTGDMATGGNTFYSASSEDFHFTPRLLMATSRAQTVLKQRQQLKAEGDVLDFEFAQAAANTFVCRFDPSANNKVNICAMRSFGESDVVFGIVNVSLAKVFSRAATTPGFMHEINEWFTLAQAKVSDIPAFRGEVNEGRPVYDIAGSIPLSGQVGLSVKFLNCGMVDYFLTEKMTLTAKNMEQKRQMCANLVTRKLQTMWSQRMGVQAASLFLNNRLCAPIRLQKAREKAESIAKLDRRLEHAIRTTQYAWKLCYGNANEVSARRQKKENPADTFISFLKRQAVIYALQRKQNADSHVFGTKEIEDDALVQEDAGQENNKRDQLFATLQLRFMMRNLWQRKKTRSRLQRYAPQTETKMNLVTRMKGGGGGGTGTRKGKTSTVAHTNPFQKFFELRKRQVMYLKDSQQAKSNRAAEQRKRNLVRFIQSGWLCSKHGKYDLLGLLRSTLLKCLAIYIPTHTMVSRECWIQCTCQTC